MVKSALLLAAIVAFHAIHTALGIPVEGVEQVLLATYQAHNS